MGDSVATNTYTMGMSVTKIIEIRVIGYTDDVAFGGDRSHMFQPDQMNFSVDINPPINFHKRYEIYLDNILTSDTKPNTLAGASVFTLNIDQFYHESISNSDNYSGVISIPNAYSGGASTEHVIIHKREKHNIIGFIHEGTILTKISGKITLNNSIIFNSAEMSPAEIDFSLVTDPSDHFKSAPEKAYDLKYFDVTKPIEIHITGGVDTEMYIFKSGITNESKAENTLVAWASGERKGNGSESDTFIDHNDDHPDHSTESRIDYPANTLKEDMYYWIVIGKYNNTVQQYQHLSTGQTVSFIEKNDNNSAEHGNYFGSGGTWSSTDITLRIKANGQTSEQSVWKSTNPNNVKAFDAHGTNDVYTDSGGRFWFRFQTFGGTDKIFSAKFIARPIIP